MCVVYARKSRVIRDNKINWPPNATYHPTANHAVHDFHFHVTIVHFLARESELRALRRGWSLDGLERPVNVAPTRLVDLHEALKRDVDAHIFHTICDNCLLFVD